MKPADALEDFILAAADDPLIHSTHVSLYMALFHQWKQCHFINPLDIKRDELMRRAKITGRATYQRCLRDLHEGGYIIYEPRYNRFVNSRIYLKNTE
jgi:hypothetical protein